MTADKPTSDSSASAELKPCPFCGWHKTTVLPWAGGENYFVVHCQRCKAEGPPAFPVEAAREMWNGRAVNDLGLDYKTLKAGATALYTMAIITEQTGGPVTPLTQRAAKALSDAGNKLLQQGGRTNDDKDFG